MKLFKGLLKLSAAVLLLLAASRTCVIAGDLNVMIADKIRQYDPQAVSVTVNVFDRKKARIFEAGDGGTITLPQQIKGLSEITLTGANGETEKVIAAVEIMEPVLSAARTIPAGTVFKDGDFEVVNKNTVELNFSPMIRAASLTGRKASKVIQKGKIMGRQDIMETPDIATGSLVTITCGDEVMKLSTEGRAEEPGSAGDMIKVRNLKSKKIIMAKVVDNNTVEVGRQ